MHSFLGLITLGNLSFPAQGHTHFRQCSHFIEWLEVKSQQGRELDILGCKSHPVTMWGNFATEPPPATTDENKSTKTHLLGEERWPTLKGEGQGACSSLGFYWV